MAPGSPAEPVVVEDGPSSDTGREKGRDSELAPIESCNVFSYLTFHFAHALLKTGYKKKLEEEDVPANANKEKARVLADRLEGPWIEECKKEKPSLLRALRKAFFWQYAVAGILGVAEVALKITSALFLRFLVDSLSTNSPDYEKYLYAMGMFLAVLFYGIFHHHVFFIQMRTGAQARLAFIGAVYRKSLRLSLSDLASAGKVVNLISNDVQRFEDTAVFLNFIWVGPVEAAAVGYFVYAQVGVAGLVGIATMFAFIPVQGIFARRFGALRKRSALIMDERIRNCADVLSGMQVIKLYAWEEPFRDRILGLRKTEVGYIKSASSMKALNEAIFFASQAMISVTTFCTAWALGETLVPSRVFASIALFGLVRVTMSNFFPKAVQGISESRVSLRRLQEFFELPDHAYSTLERERALAANLPVVDVRSASFQWPTVEVAAISGGAVAAVAAAAAAAAPSSKGAHGDANKEGKRDVFRLENISLQIKRGELLAIVGSVGCGKSSLLMALLGEMRKVRGTVNMLGRIGFHAQSPWIMAATIRDNILFGQPYDEARFRAAVASCALDQDLEQFPEGADTIIGEHGVNLSGGQRARVSLARVAYSQSDVVLLDDPLSAVDARVGRHIFENCIRGILRDRAVILVTHQLQFVSAAEKVLVLDKGLVTVMGTYGEACRAAEGLFSSMVAHDDNIDDTAAGEAKGGEEASKAMAVATANTAAGTGTGAKPGGEERVAEERRVGQVGMRTYWNYFRAGNHIPVLLFMVVALFGGQAVSCCADWWLANWSAQDPGTQRSTLYIIVFVSLIGATVLISIVRAEVFFRISISSSSSLFGRMLAAVMRAPMHFFEVNPHGRVLNRFAKDQALADETLPVVYYDFLQCVLIVLGAVAMVGLANAWVLLSLIPILVAFQLLRVRYLKTARELKRIESTLRSPVFSHISATLDGLATIRAFGAQPRFQEKFEGRQDSNTRAFISSIIVARWFGFRLDLVTALFLGACAFLSVPLRNSISPALVALSLSYVLQLTGCLQWASRQSAEVENLMTSVERIVEYTQLEPEAAPHTAIKPPKDWPTVGAINLRGMYLTYPLSPAPVLKGLTLSVNPKEKVGIVGRTGAGKSSLLQALFRLVEPSPPGCIAIDGVDVSQLGLADLRGSLAIIPQEPFLFKGDVRFNLDPFGRYDDAQVWAALDAAGLRELVWSLPGGLGATVTENGKNFSAGERQLFCLARAALTGARVLVMDEATANVDAATDRLVQARVRDAFRNATVLTIAHRLHTVIDYDRILVLSHGNVLEFDTPKNLLTDHNSALSSMVRETGPEAAAQLRLLAGVSPDSDKASGDGRVDRTAGDRNGRERADRDRRQNGRRKSGRRLSRGGLDSSILYDTTLSTGSSQSYSTTTSEL